MMAHFNIMHMLVAMSMAAESSAEPPVSVGELTVQAMGAFDKKGNPNIPALEAILKDMGEKISASGAYRNTTIENDALDPFTSGSWTLWVFWAADIPESVGLAAAINQVKGSQSAQVQTIHLASLRNMEAFLFNVNDLREATYEAGRRGDRKGVAVAAGKWNDYMANMVDMTRDGVSFPLMSPTSQARALKVEEVPAFRLVSPSQVVHKLNGFSEGVDLVAWIRRCQDWETTQRQKGKLP